MTNHWIDIANSDCILIIGANPAENHPISFKWVIRGMDRGAKLISVDPRFTRTSSLADIYAPLRSGTDIAFIGGLIHYTLENQLYHREHVAEYTNGSFLIDSSFSFEDGLFSGYDPASRRYDKSSWRYQTGPDGIPLQDKTLSDPNCVFQLLKKHFSRYDPDTVCRITGTPKEVYLKVVRTFCETGSSGRAGTILYAMGATQHTHGTQNIRSYAILQLLLGNLGVAGGGINALRGESNVQGSTDHALLFHILPGYLKVPTVKEADLAAYLKKRTPSTGDPKSANWWQHTPKYMVSLLKAFYGDYAVSENDFCYDYLPKASGNYSHISLFEAMYKEKIKGLMVFGQNPAVGGPNCGMERKALENLDWMVSVDLWETETAAFWKRPGVKSEEIKTEVFHLPAAASFEKEGSITNSGRWSQWRYKALNPPGDARPDLHILDSLYRSLREEYEKDGGPYPDPILHLSWNYGAGEPDSSAVAREINGRFLKDVTFEKKNLSFRKGEQVPNFTFLKDDGSTASGNWLYCGSFPQAGNMAARRDRTDAENRIGLYPNWAWCWPVNRRILYNRSSCNPRGEPYDEEHPVIRWDMEKRKWIGDVPDGGWPPGEKHPFIMKPEGVARLFALGLADGPFPEHYEPLESPVKNLLSSIEYNPAVKVWDTEGVDAVGTSDRFPIVATTYRVSEHWQAGQMTRNLPWLVELMPDAFLELGTDLARRKGIQNGDQVNIVTARGKMTAYALVTERFQPFQVNGNVVDEIGIPWHYGYMGLAKGDSANLLTPHVGDANTMIPEFKAFLCDIMKKK